MSSGGSILVYIYDKIVVIPADKPLNSTKKRITSPETKIEILHPNVLALDYADLDLMGENKGNMYYAKASDLIYQRFGYPNSCP